MISLCFSTYGCCHPFYDIYANFHMFDFIIQRLTHQSKLIVNNCMLTGWDPMPTFNWVWVEYQSIASKILTQPSRYKRAGSTSSLLADEKGPNHWKQLVFWVIHLYFYWQHYFWTQPSFPC